MNLTPLSPFGTLVSGGGDASLDAIDADEVRSLIHANRLVVFRGFVPLVGEELTEYCARLGEILEWDFGAVNDLSFKPEKNNYIYMGGDVPFHWDGAFADRKPRFIFFHCDRAGEAGDGGETLFADTTLVLSRASAEVLESWEPVRITYETEKVVHYGGSFTVPLFAIHPDTGDRVLRYAEPVEDVNPVSLTIEGWPASGHAELIADLHDRLHDDGVCYAHRWQVGDIVVADNHALVHGRRAFAPGAAGRRAIRRVNIL